MTPFTWTDDYSRTDPSTHVARNKQVRPKLRVFRVSFDVKFEDLDVLFDWLLHTPSRSSIHDLAFSTLQVPAIKAYTNPLRQPSIDFVNAIAPSVSTLKIDCRGRCITLQISKDPRPS